MKVLKPDVILFDIDDTLYSSKAPHENAMAKISEIFSIHYSLNRTDAEQLFEQCKSSVKLVLGQTAASHSRLLYFQRMLETIQVDDIPRKAILLEDTYWDTYINMIQRDERLVKIFQQIKDDDIKIGIVTDLTASIQMKKLIKLGVSNYINAIVTSEESGQDKPNFVCFSLINEKLNRHHSRLNYWMVGDNIEKDLTGSKVELDATTFLVSKSLQHKRVCEDTPVDVVLNDIYAIYAYIN